MAIEKIDVINDNCCSVGSKFGIKKVSGDAMKMIANTEHIQAEITELRFSIAL